MRTADLADDIRKHSGWSLVFGILTALLGLFLIAYPLATATITTVLLGWVLIFVAISQFVFALHSETVGRFFWKVILAVLYGIGGVVLAFFPIAGVAALTVVLGTLLLIYAGVATAMAFEARPIHGWGWLLFDAVASFLMAILILTRWPSSSVWVIGTLVGASVLMGGITRTMIAARIRSAVRRIEATTRKAA